MTTSVCYECIKVTGNVFSPIYQKIILALKIAPFIIGIAGGIFVWSYVEYKMIEATEFMDVRNTLYENIMPIIEGFIYFAVILNIPFDVITYLLPKGEHIKLQLPFKRIKDIVTEDEQLEFLIRVKLEYEGDSPIPSTFTMKAEQTNPKGVALLSRFRDRIKVILGRKCSDSSD